MTKPTAVFITLVLLVSSLGAGLGAGAQEAEVLTVPQALEEFGSVLEDEGLTLVVIHLNDKSVEALFSTAPNMQELQGQAKEATMFFVQGTNGTSETLVPALEWQVSQGKELIATRPVNIANFEENSEVPDGERYSGLGPLTRAEQEEAEAFKLYRIAAELGVAGAQCRLGVMYAEGRGVTQDDTESVRWFQLAAE